MESRRFGGNRLMKVISKKQEKIENLLQGKSERKVARESRKHNRKVRLLQVIK